MPDERVHQLGFNAERARRHERHEVHQWLTPSTIMNGSDDDRAVPPCWTLKLVRQASRSPGPEALGRGAKAALRMPSGDELMTAACPDWSRQANGVAPFRTEERHCLCEVAARSVLFEGPKRFGATDDRGRRDRPEVAAIERARLVPVHEKHFT